jgi:hypothetical protein
MGSDELERFKASANKIAGEMQSTLTDNEVAFLKMLYKEEGKEAFANAISAVEGTVKEGEVPANGDFGMSQKEIKLRQILDKIINKGSLGSLAGVLPAAMSGHPGLALGLGVAAMVGAFSKDAAWWKSGGHNYGAQSKYGVKESKKGFSIATALDKMDSVIGEDTSDKVNDILNSLTESEREALLNTLKKKV